MKKATENFRHFLFTHTWGTDLAIDIHKYLEISKKIIDQEVSTAMICSDPMNGCPGDFAEDGSRKIHSLECEFESWDFKIPSWILKILDKRIHKHYNKAWESFHNLPWNQEPEGFDSPEELSEIPY